MNILISLSLIFLVVGALFGLGCVLADIGRYVAWARKSLKWQRTVEQWARWGT